MVYHTTRGIAAVRREISHDVSPQLDILALEPFYGGARRVMLESLVKCSRHRWTLLKLPPRRIERRLTAAAHWFGEILQRHWAGQCDLLFTSEAMNLSDLYRVVPWLLKKPSVVYFHGNQLPDPDSPMETSLDLVNLNTAAAGTEIWFNSLYHLRGFLAKATALVRRHPELSGRNPMPEITAKAHLMSAPVDYSPLNQILGDSPPKREKRTVFLETRDADIDLLNRALNTVQRRGEHFKLFTVGNLAGLNEDFKRETLSETDDAAQMRAMLQSGVFVSGRIGAPCDHHAIRALAAGCWPLLPSEGSYRELLPESLHPACLYNGEPDTLAGRLQDAWHLERPSGYEEQLTQILQRFDPAVACATIDQRLEELVAARMMR
ncbi:MAG: tRNA-queuosine alpha-mannosyltransferase domain-containing protein [Tepidisphaeraceae bacterium]